VLCGAEGSLAFVTEAKINLVPIPQHTVLLNIRYGSFDAALRDAAVVMKLEAASSETVDARVLALAREDPIWLAVKDYFPDDPEGPPQGVNIVELLADSEADLAGKLARIEAELASGTGNGGRRGYTVARGEAAASAIWSMRKKSVGLLGNMQGEARPVPFVEDTVVPPEHLADYIAEFRAVLDKRGLVYGMFGHVDAGCLHVRPALDMKDPAQEALIREISDEVFALTRKYRGVLWGEHGKGRAIRVRTGVLRQPLPADAGDQGRLRSTQSAEPGQDRRPAWPRSAPYRRRADARTGRSAHSDRGAPGQRGLAALQRQRGLLQLRPGRCDVSVLEGDARAQAFAQGTCFADARMAAAAGRSRGRFVC
jgi:hypothetical protein